MQSRPHSDSGLIAPEWPGLPRDDHKFPLLEFPGPVVSRARATRRPRRRGWAAAGAGGRKSSWRPEPRGALGPAGGGERGGRGSRRVRAARLLGQPANTAARRRGPDAGGARTLAAPAGPGGRAGLRAIGASETRPGPPGRPGSSRGRSRQAEARLSGRHRPQGLGTAGLVVGLHRGTPPGAQFWVSSSGQDK